MRGVVTEPADEMTGEYRAGDTARAVIECAANAIVAFGIDQTVLLWNPAAERMFGWAAPEVVGLKPPIIPEELKAEHNAVLERVRGGGQISFATRRIRKDGSMLDVRIDTSVLLGSGGEVTGWVNVCHQAGEDSARTSGPSSTAALTGLRYWTGPAWSGSGTRPPTSSPVSPQMTPWASRRRSRSRSRAPSSPTGCPAAAGWMSSAPRWPAVASG